MDQLYKPLRPQPIHMDQLYKPLWPQTIQMDQLYKPLWSKPIHMGPLDKTKRQWQQRRPGLGLWMVSVFAAAMFSSFKSWTEKFDRPMFNCGLMEQTWWSQLPRHNTWHGILSVLVRKLGQFTKLLVTQVK